jgi:hypothetical protein
MSFLLVLHWKLKVVRSMLDVHILEYAGKVNEAARPDFDKTV